MEDLDTLKARVSPGDSIRFDFKGQKLEGSVSTLGLKRVVVIALDGNLYRVPYSRIEPNGERKDHAVREQEALENCRKLLAKYGLSDWSAGLDDSLNRAGVCHFSKKHISFSRLFLRTAPEEEIFNTILHEIAHALVGPKHNHDSCWRTIARQIGCSGVRCHEIKFSQPRWIVHCPNGCFTLSRNRRMRGVCKKCRQPPRFLPWTKELALELNLHE